MISLTITAMAHAIAGLHDLPEISAVAVANFVEAAQQSFGDNLHSIVLYGSAAEGRLRASSDINLLLVLTSFDRKNADAIRGQFSLADSVVRLTAMFLLESEIQSAGEMFAQKFSDILRRHRVLYGPDPFTGISIPRSAVILRLKQVLLNLTLRLREAYIERGATPERISALIADSAGPLRSCASTIRSLDLEGKPEVHPPEVHPKEALIDFVASLNETGWDEVLARISEAREREFLSPDVADATLFRLIELAQRLRARVETMG
ncbi:MAG TPA: nucleotidyltransferase domain-containing protein [Candidatus Angelobacter sp.]|nr:nucleotidyltransferase domain-containing protein [Candidatus Angelobacter sp.]